MKQAHFRFYAELNDFLPPGRRSVAFAREFELSASVKDMIEALGVPHPEISLILVNGRPVDFTWQVQDGDMISVYPPWHSIDVTGTTRVPARALHEARFVLDIHLGRLARYLRMLGFDAVYHTTCSDEDLAEMCSGEDRMLLTRDRGLLKRAAIGKGYYVRETDPRRQFSEVVRRFDLSGAVSPFRRCLRCNSPLRVAPKQSASHRLEEKTARHYDDFWICPGCDRVYWKGSHYEHMRRFMARVLPAG